MIDSHRSTIISTGAVKHYSFILLGMENNLNDSALQPTKAIQRPSLVPRLLPGALALSRVNINTSGYH